VLVSLERQQREAERARAETEVLLRFAQATSRSETPAEIYEPALDAAAQLLGAERSAILLFDESDRMQFQAWRGLSDAYRSAVDGHSPWSRTEKDARPISDVTTDERMAAYRSIFSAEKIGAIGFVPLVSGDLLGKFMLYWEQPRTFSQHDDALALAVASQVAEALARTRLFEAERRARERAESAERRRAAIQLVSDAALAHLQIEPLLTELLARVRRVFHCDTATVLMLSGDGKRLAVRACDGIEREAWDRLAVPYGAGVAGAVVAQGRPIVVNDVATADVASSVVRDRLRSMMCVPLVLEQGTVGVVHIGFFERQELPEDHVDLLQTVAARVATAIDRANAYEALRRAEEKLRVALSAGRMGVWEWSIPEGRVAWSPTLERIHGLEPGTFPGTFDAYQSDVHPDDKETLLRTVQETLASGREHHIEYRIILPDGEVRWVAGHGNIVARDDGQPGTMMGVCMDITEKRAAEQAVRDSETRYRTLFEVSVYGVITIDEDGVVETANPAAERMFGYSTTELVGRNISVLMPEPYKSGHDGYLQNYRRSGERKIIGIGREVVGRRKDGSTFPMDLAVSEFWVSGKRYFKGLVNDISARKELEQAREAAVAELQQTLHYNEIFAGVLAHDLRNPLNAIQTATQLVLHREQGKADLAPLRRVLASGDRMARMIDQLLDFTKTRVGGGFELRPREADLSQLSSQVLAEIELAYPAWKVKVDSHGELTGTWDPDRLLQVVSNLVTNAGQHGTRGAEIQIALDGTSLDAVMFQVHNEGNIPEALLSDIFAPFRGTRDLRSSTSGLGLGIYIAREIVRAHGGTIEVASSEAAGTTFSVTLPRHAQQPSQAHAHDHQSPGEGDAAAGERRSSEGGWVLVVEDDRDQAELYADICAQAGLNVMTAATGGQAYRKARDLEPALIVLDLALPDTDGWDICRRLKSDERTRSIPIVILTASNDPDSVKRATQVGCAGFLRKPCPPADLVATIHRALGDRAVVSH
jgi:PAS domain S-box-containing protein